MVPNPASLMTRILPAAAGLLLLAVLAAPPAAAEVRFGNGVRIGGHDFSNQTYNRRRRLEVRLSDRPVRGAGCVWRADGRGGKVRFCRLQRVNRP